MSAARRLPAWIALPYARLELPGWGGLLRTVRVLGPGANEVWSDAPPVRLRGKWHGYTMTLDLQNWSERLSFFLGRYYDLPTQLTLRSLLRPGDRMLDVGANIGMISLLAARLVGPGGRIDAFEPNPRCEERLRQMLRDNRIQHVEVYPFGLSDCAAQAQLTLPDASTGSGTLSDVPLEARSPDARYYDVRVCRGDDVIAGNPGRPIAVKIDVEGHEVRVLRGLGKTIERAQPAFLVETIPEHLERAGSGVEELVGLLRDHGYRGHQMLARRAGLGFRLALPCLEGVGAWEATDTLWLHPESEAHSRLADLLPARPATAS